MLRTVVITLCILIFTGCRPFDFEIPKSGETFTVSGVVNGLEGESLRLAITNGSPLDIQRNGAFSFADSFDDGEDYIVTIATQPDNPKQTCEIEYGVGRIDASDVDNVRVSCITDTPPVSNSYAVSIEVVGLLGTGLVVQNNGTDNVAVSADGIYSFETRLSDAAQYQISISQMPINPPQICHVSAGSGTIAGADIEPVSINCQSETISVGGTVSGLSESGLVLQNNGANDLSIVADGSFNFVVNYNSSYQISIFSQPGAFEVCTLTNAEGSVVYSSINNVQITCEKSTYRVAVNVTGMQGSGLVLQNNLADDLTINGDGVYFFTNRLLNADSYSITQKTPSTGFAETCQLENASGVVSGTDVNNLNLTCVADSIGPGYVIGGTVSGLQGTGLVLSSNGESLTINNNGTFQFSESLQAGANYLVSVTTQPNSPDSVRQTCRLENEAGTISDANISNIGVVCVEASGYDIVYVRYPNETPEYEFITIPQGEKAYNIAEGADLILLKPDGSEVVLVDCVRCSVMDPFISFDGETVYYSLIEEATRESASWIYKIRLTGGDFTPIRLTFDDGFDSMLYANNTTDEHDQSDQRGIRDMAPSPLADGRIVFTSNRSALTAFHPGPNSMISSIQQLYVLDDHDGSKNTAVLSNLHRLETGNLHMVQHPFQLKDGRIIFSTWQDVGTKFTYAMTTLFTVHPDGSNLQQFTEPHDHHKTVDHFATQIPNGDVIAGYYYPSFDYGFGLLMRYPIDPEGVDYLRGSVDQRYPWGNQFRVSFREFDRKGTQTITPHTVKGDVPAPNASGKYSMPSATIDEGLLVAYSTGTVNFFDSACARNGVDLCDPLRSGIYMIENAATAMIFDPATLVKIKDDPNYNEIWPRAVVSYNEIYGQETPDLLANISQSPPSDNRMEAGEATGLVGTSSMYNREPLNEADADRFRPSTAREIHDGNWKIEGAEAGAVSNSDIYGVRIVATPQIPFTKPVSRWGGDRTDWDAVIRYALDNRLSDIVARFGSLHGERWEILGEFPLTYKNVLDPQGNPDTSWLAKIPAETPFLIQALDANGMTLISELTWRALKPSEKAVNCGGCHAHSIEPLDFATTQAGLSTPIRDVANLDNLNPMIQNGVWDLTQGKIPLLAAAGVEVNDGYSFGVEFNRDILPIINAKCISCHNSTGTGSMLVLDGSGGAGDPYSQLVDNPNNTYRTPQKSKYIRIPQARQSLLVWVAWGARLDGRTNDTRSDDVDYPAHPLLMLTDKEKRAFSRWVDLGSAIDFPVLTTPDTAGFRYTDDYQLPIINTYLPKRGVNESTSGRIGFVDAKSGLDWNSLVVTYYPVDGSDTEKTISMPAASATNVVSFELPELVADKEYILKTQIQDMSGNRNIETIRFSVN